MVAVTFSLFAGPAIPFFNATSGAALAGGKIYTYAAGTTDPVVTYADSQGNVPNSNPIILDSAGRLPNSIWIAATTPYTKFVIKTSTDSLIGTYDHIPPSSDISALAVPGGSLLVGYQLPYAGTVARTVGSKLTDNISILDFGADPTGVQDSTFAFYAAQSFAASLLNYSSSNYFGNCVKVRLPASGVFKISNFNFGGGGLIFEGDMAYTRTEAANIYRATIICTEGDYAVFMDPGEDFSGRVSKFSGFRNCTFKSTGNISPATYPTPPVITHGVQFGIITTMPNAIFDNVMITGFQYGIALAGGCDGTIIDSCSFIGNTRAGMVTTNGNNVADDLYYPEVVFAIANRGGNDSFSINNCLFTENAWGIILRDGSPTAVGNNISYNVFGGLIGWVGYADVSIGGCWIGGSFEENWTHYDPTYDFNSIALNGYQLLRNTVGTYINISSGSTQSTNDYGYQLALGCIDSSGTSGPSVTFDKIQFKVSASANALRKIILVKQGVANKFLYCKSTLNNSDSIRLEQPSSSFAAEHTLFFDYEHVLTLTYPGNQFCQVQVNPDPPGGLVMRSGAWAGPVVGDVTGDVTGNVTGDVTGNVTGDLAGNVTGDVTGDVTGTLIGNAQVGDVIFDLPGGATVKRTLNRFYVDSFTPRVVGADSGVYTEGTGTFMRIGSFTHCTFEINNIDESLYGPAEHLNLTGFPYQFSEDQSFLLQGTPDANDYPFPGSLGGTTLGVFGVAGGTVGYLVNAGGRVVSNSISENNTIRGTFAYHSAGS